MGKNNIGEKLKTSREAKGWTLKRVSDLTGITEVSLSRYENNKRIPDAVILEKLCRVYDISADWLLELKRRKPWDDKSDG